MLTSEPAPGDEAEQPTAPRDPQGIAVEDDYRARKQAFLDRSAELRALTAGREHTPAEQLIREARDRGYGRLWPQD